MEQGRELPFEYWLLRVLDTDKINHIMDQIYS